MAYISYIEYDDASPELRRHYDHNRESEGRVDNILRIHGHNPPSLSGHARFYQTLMHGRSELSRTQREMIAIVVSTLNQCRY